MDFVKLFDKMSSKPRLLYFDGAGRAELSRTMLRLAGIDFDDVRLKWGEEFEKVKADKVNGSGRFFGSVPVYYEGDFALCESMAIVLYLNDKIHPTLTPKQRAVDAMFIGLNNDLQQAMYKCLYGEEQQKKEAREKFGDVVAKFVVPLEERLLPSKGFVHGLAEPSAADLAIYDFCYSPSPSLTCLGIDVSKYPKTKALCDLVAKHPKLKSYLENRK